MSEAEISEAFDAATRWWLDLIRIRRDQWDDMELPVETYEPVSH